MTSLWKNAISKLSDIHIAYEQGTIEERRRIIGSMFPEKLVFEGTRHRTTRINEALRFMMLMSSKLEGKKRDKFRIFYLVPSGVIPLGFAPSAKISG